jgi:hypothetical protein
VSDPVAEFVHMFKPQPWVADAACRGLTTLFYSISTVDIAQAKKVCAGCPVIDECRQAAQERPTRFGVWGGQSVKQQRAERIGVRGYAQRKPVPHGTNAGYQAHLRNGTPVCDPCREAKRISTSYYKREREMAS